MYSIERTRELHLKLSEYVLEAGVNKELWSRLPYIANLNDVNLERVYTFLIQLEQTEWEQLNNLHNQMCANRDALTNLKLIGAELPESKRLKAINKSLRKRWVTFKEKFSGAKKPTKEEAGREDSGCTDLLPTEPELDR